jgi:hypothetical protein
VEPLASRCPYTSAPVTALRPTARPVHNPSRFRLAAFATLAARSARPSTVVDCQHREHSSP